MNGSPATEKIGIFWLSTKQLKTSIIGTSVRIIFEARTRSVGLTEGPPILTLGSMLSFGPLSLGSPAPPNNPAQDIVGIGDLHRMAKETHRGPRGSALGALEDLQGDRVPGGVDDLG